MVRILKPTSPGRRGMTVADFSGLTKKRPQKSLTTYIKRKGGRNNQGKLTVRHQGGGAKRLYRLVDFKMLTEGKAKVIALEYDPYRSARIVLVEFADGSRQYVLAPQAVTVGMDLDFSPDAEVKPGNRLPLRNIPAGTLLYNIELTPGKGGQLVRSAGVFAQLAGKEGSHALIKLPSGEFRKIQLEARASIGSVSNPEHGIIRIGKAGRNRHKGVRPTVRGSAMDPSSHPHGGGEGRTSIGMPGPKTPWGKPALGYKTRKPQTSDKLIVRRRDKKARG